MSATHLVRFVFLLGFTRSDGHVKVLQVLLKNLQKRRLHGLPRTAPLTADEYFTVIHAMRGPAD